MAPTELPGQPEAPQSLAGRRIGIVGMHYAPETTGNAPYTTALAEALEEGGAAVLVLTGVPHYPQWQVYPEYRRGLRWAKRDGRTVVLRRRHWVPRTPNTVGRGLMEATFLTQAFTTLPGLHVDALIAVTPMLSSMVTCAALSRLTGIPWGALVQDLTGVGAQQSAVASRSVSSAIAKVEYRLLQGAKAVGVIAPEFGQTLVEGGVERHRILETPNFTHVEPSSASQSEARRRLGWPEDRFLVIHTGNMGMKQGLEVAIEAARTAGSECFDLVLVGHGNQRQELVRKAVGVSNVHFLDPVPPCDYPLVLSAADVLIVTERPTAGSMSLPSKLTSYMASGRPIVASVPNPGITHRTLGASGAGLVVTAGEPRELVNAINMVKHEGTLAVELSDRALEYARTRLSKPAAHARYRGLAEQILRTHSAPISASYAPPFA